MFGCQDPQQENLFVVARESDSLSSVQVCQLPINARARFASVVLRQVTHVCVGEEVAGGDAADSLVDVHGCDLSRSPETQMGLY